MDRLSAEEAENAASCSSNFPGIFFSLLVQKWSRQAIHVNVFLLIFSIYVK